MKDCVVAFIDILGFSKFIEDATDSDIEGYYNSFFNKVAKNHKDFSCQVTEQYIDESTKKMNIQICPQVTFFSDCIIISVPIDPIKLLFGGREIKIERALQTVGDFVSELVEWHLEEKGFLMRGAISFGKLIHNHKTALGKPYVEAVKKEKDTCYPRIAVCSSLIKEIVGCQYAEEYIKTDIDGEKIFNWYKRIKKDDKRVGAMLNNIDCGLKKYSNDDKVIKKWQWFSKYVNDERIIEDPEALARLQILSCVNDFNK